LSAKQAHKSKIGGQALIEGVMMRGPEKEAMAVRQKDGEIFTEVVNLPANKWYQKTPFVRGVFNFVLQMKNGYKYLMKSMEKSGMLDEEEEEKKDDKSEKNEETPAPEKSEDSDLGALGVIGVILGIALAVGLFVFLPAQGFSLISRFIDSRFQSLFEGVIRIILFVAYMWAVSLMKDIRVTYEYHGAEHKTIAAYEAGETLTPENVKKYTRFHPRCGTSFIFLVLAISIIFYSVLGIFLPINSDAVAELLNVSKIVANLIRTVVKLLFLPFLVGVTYEVIKLAGRYDRNIFMRIISAPGLALQRLTTREPDEKQIEVAIAAIIPVIPEDKSKDQW